MDRNDFSCIKDYKIGDVYELPNTVHRIKIFGIYIEDSQNLISDFLGKYKIT